MNDEIDRGSRPEHTEGRKKDVSEEGVATIDDDLIAREHPYRRASRVEQVDRELFQAAALILSQHSDAVPISRVAGTTGLGDGLGNRGLRSQGVHRRTSHFSGNGNSDQ